MADVLVDANVLLDYLNQEGEWFDWSQQMLTEAAHQGAVAVNPIIYAEVAVGYASIEDLDEVLPRAYFGRLPLPWEAAFLASRVFQQYRRQGGSRTTVLPEFFIGAHAAVAGLTLLTRDARRYQCSFCERKVLCPSTLRRAQGRPEQRRGR